MKQVRVLEVGLIGAGRVGSTLASLLHPQRFRLGPVLGRTPTSARRCVREMEKGAAASGLDEFQSCAVILIAVPEQMLGKVVRELSESHVALKKKVILHTSRVHSSADLHALRRCGASVGSLQPLFVFHRPMASLSGVHFAVEGDAGATRIARRMIRGWDGEFHLVRADQKMHLGIASSIAADFLPALLEMAVRQMSRAGFLKKRSLESIRQILDVAFDEYARGGRRCRPGPILEGDATVVRAYLETMERTDKDQAEMYRRMARQTLTVLGRASDDLPFLDQSGDAGRRTLGAAAGGGKT